MTHLYTYLDKWVVQIYLNGSYLVVNNWANIYDYIIIDYV